MGSSTNSPLRARPTRRRCNTPAPRSPGYAPADRGKRDVTADRRSIVVNSPTRDGRARWPRRGRIEFSARGRGPGERRRGPARRAIHLSRGQLRSDYDANPAAAVPGTCRVRPHLAVFYGIWQYNGVEYDHIGDTATTVAKWYVAPLAGGAVVLLVAVSYFGWWRPVLFEPRRQLPRWLWIAPILMVAAGVLNLFVKEDYDGVTLNLIGLLILGSVAVGFCEETATRGVLIVGFRSRFAEPTVWLLSTLLFALLHLPNWVFGAGPSALFQVVITFMSGSALFLVRRLSGSLVPAMALHGFWDFSSFLGTTAGFVVVLTLLVGIVGLASAIALALRERGIHVEQFGVARQEA